MDLLLSRRICQICPRYFQLSLEYFRSQGFTQFVHGKSSQMVLLNCKKFSAAKNVNIKKFQLTLPQTDGKKEICSERKK